MLLQLIKLCEVMEDGNVYVFEHGGEGGGGKGRGTKAER